MTITRCPDHLDKQPCRGCAADAKAADDRHTAAREALARQGVPRDRVRAILAGATTHTPDPRLKD